MTSRPFRLLPLLVALITAGALLVPGIAAADREEDCDESITTCDVNQMNYVIPMEARQLTAVVPIRDDEDARRLYRDILPDVYDMPENPMVSFWVVDVDIPNEQMSAAHWMEGAISIRMSYKDEDGWFHLSQPTDSTDAYDLGRDAGFPKYMATMTYEETEDSAHTRTTISDHVTRDFRWQKTDGEPGEGLRQLTGQELPQFSLHPVFEGPQKVRVKYTPQPYVPTTHYRNRRPNVGEIEVGAPEQQPVTDLSDPEYGSFTYRVDPDLDRIHALAAQNHEHSTPMPDLFPGDANLADLIPAEGEVPGMFWHAEHNLVIQNKDLGTDGAPAAQCAPAKHEGGAWPTYGQELNNDRQQEAEKKIGVGNAATLEPGFMYPTAAAGRYYVEEYSSELQREDALSGTPIVAGGCVYAGTRTGMVFALNADTGEPVWITQVEARVPTLAYDVSGGVPRVFVNVAAFHGDQPNPHMVALHAQTGEVLWKTGPLDDLPGSELTGSPTPFTVAGRDMVSTGVSGWPGDDQAQEDWYTPGAHRGSWVIVDQQTGGVLQQEYVVPDEQFCRDEPPSETCHNDPEKSGSYDGYSGAGVWSTAAVDGEAGYAYYGSGNPSSDKHPDAANALLKIDVHPDRDTFGHLVDHYEGERDREPYPDIDFGASPNLYEREDGSQWVGAFQKSGVWHMADTTIMDGVWRQMIGAVGTTSGNAATAATDGTSIYQPTGAIPQQLLTFAVVDGSPQWVQPTPMQGLYGPATLANGVVYIADQGILRAFEAETGAPLLARPVWADVQGQADSADAGSSVARNTLYANGGNYLVAYRLPGDPRNSGGSDGGSGGDGQGSDSGDTSGERQAAPASGSEDTPATGGGAATAAAGLLLAGAGAVAARRLRPRSRRDLS